MPDNKGVEDIIFGVDIAIANNPNADIIYPKIFAFIFPLFLYFFLINIKILMFKYLLNILFYFLIRKVYILYYISIYNK